ncbi:Uncharacterised protein [Bordetella pertussis]|nr:Uncharacterised protein [Bordetella pertussis]
MQVQRVGVALRAVADDGDGFALDQGEIAVFVVENFHVVLRFLNFGNREC